MNLASGYRLEEAVPLDQLKPHPKNPNQGDVGAIADSIDTVGFYGVVTAQLPRNGRKTGRILAGEHRWRAAQTEHAATIPVCWLDINDEAAERILLGDNQIARLSTMDIAAQAAMLERLSTTERGLGGTGMDGDDLDKLLAELAASDEPDEPPAAGAPPANPVTATGDVWLLGEHRVMCGDSRDPDDVARLLGAQGVHMAFTSPPYADRRTYDGSTTFLPVKPDDYVEWFAPVSANVADHLEPDGSWFVNIRAGANDGQRELYVHDLVAAHVRQWGWMFVDDLCWVDTNNGVPGGWPNRFKDAWEPVFHFSMNGDIKFRPYANAHHSEFAFESIPGGYDKSSTGSGLLSSSNIEQHDGVARPSNVIQLASGVVQAKATGHSAVFPVGLPAWFIRAYTDEGDNIYDPFVGSGTTILAADQHDRVGYGMELSPAYVDVICNRWQLHTETMPTLEATGEPHDFT